MRRDDLMQLARLKMMMNMGWRDGLSVQSTDCSCKGPGFSSQHPCQLTTTATPVPRDPTPSLAFTSTCAHSLPTRHTLCPRLHTGLTHSQALRAPLLPPSSAANTKHGHYNLATSLHFIWRRKHGSQVLFSVSELRGKRSHFFFPDALVDLFSTTV